MTQKTIVSSGSQAAIPSPHDMALDVKKVAGEAADQAKKFAEGEITTRKDRAVDALSDVAEALRAAGGRLNTKNGAEAVQYVTRVADGLDKASGYLKDRNLTDVMRDVEGFARREPAVFLGGAFVVGLVGSRFLKSSGAPRKQPGASSSGSGASLASSSGGGRQATGNSRQGTGNQTGNQARSGDAGRSTPSASSASASSSTGSASKTPQSGAPRDGSSGTSTTGTK